MNAGIPLVTVMAVKGGYELSYSQVSGATSSDSTGNLIWAAFGRKLSSLATVGTSGTYSLQSFERTRIGNVSLFSTYELPARLSLSASLGYSVLNSKVGNLSTISTNTNASYRFGNAGISVGIFQDFNQTFTTGENFGIVLTRSYWGSFGYALTPLIDTSLRATYSENEPTGVGNTQPNQNTFSAQASLGWRLRRWLTMGLDYTYNRYNSGASTNGTANGTVNGIAPENRVTIRLSASF
jgi:hypothetical protein